MKRFIKKIYNPLETHIFTKKYFKTEIKNGER